MKKLFCSALFIIFIGFFFGCQKEDELSNVQTEEIRSQLASLPAPSKEEVKTKLSSDGLKSATVDNQPVLALILQLDGWTYEINSEWAVKYFVYYEIGQDGYRQKTLTLVQKFPVVNGQIVTSQYNLEVRVGYLFYKTYYLNDQNNIQQLIYLFRFDDGQQISFFNKWTGEIDLPPIGKGKWQIEVVYGGDMEQRYHTNPINYDTDSNVLTLSISLYSENNIESNINIDKDIINGFYLLTLQGINKGGQYCFLNYPVLWDNNLPQRIIYSAHFDIENVTVCGGTGCFSYFTKNAKSTTISLTGVKTYFF